MRFLCQILLSFFLLLSWNGYAQLPPLIIGQTPNPIVVNEDQSVTIQLTNLTVLDLDSTYPDDFSLTVDNGSNYSFFGNTVSPDPDYNGMLSVIVTVNDGTSNSLPFSLQVQVDPVNDEPSFAKGTEQTIFEDAGAQSIAGWATSISEGPANENSQTLTFNLSNDNNSLFSVQPSINSTGTLTYTPNINANGIANVSVILTDNGGTANGGDDTFDTQTFTITVTSVNDQPSFAKGLDQIVLEDAAAQTINGWANSINPGSGENGQVLTFNVSNDNISLFSVQPSINSTTGTLTYTPAANANGIANVSVILTDDGGTANGGDDTFATQAFTITITAVNDEPTFVKGIDQSVNEGAGNQNINGWATSISKGPSNESTQTVTFNLTNDNNSLFLQQPSINESNGNLSFRPAAGVSGVATVTVVLSDNGGVANGGDDNSSQTFTITVVSVNDEPSFVKGGNQTILEDASPQTVAGWATSITAGPGESGQLLTFNVSNDNTGLFSVQPSINSTTGTLTYTLAANANGVTNVTVILTDNGGTANGGDDTSDSQTFTITATAVNDEPSFTKGLDQNIAEGAGLQTVAGWATSMSAGPANESTQTLMFGLTNTNNALFSVQPVINSAGTLTYAPAVSASGSATVNVVLSDDGGTANGGDNTYSTQTFTITIASINNEPSFVAGGNQTILEDAAAQTVAGWATSISAGPGESGQVLTFNVTNDNTSLFSAQPSINSTTGTLTYTPLANVNGVANVSVILSDNGGTANGGDDTFTTQTFTITISPVNDLPLITGQVSLSTIEEQPLLIVLSNLLVTDIDNNYPTGFTLTVFTGTNYTVSGTTVTPNANVTGVISVGVRVNDGSGNSNTFNLQITVDPLNDPPVISGQSSLSTNEDQSISLQLSNLNVTDPDNTYPTGFTLAATGGSNYTVSGNTITPALNFTGTLSVSVTVNDGINNSNPFAVSITVNPMNDAPVISGQVPISIAEVQPITISLSQLIVFDPDDSYPADFDLFVLSGSNYSVTGDVVTPIANFSGTLLVRVFVSDGTANSAIYNLQILVNSTNDAPIITGQQALSTNEDQAKAILFSNLFVTDPDNTYPTGFTLTILSGSNYTFSGTTITPALNFTGTLSVGVKVNDGTVDSAPFNLQITVNPVNDAPVITGQSFLSTNEEASIALQLSNLTVTDPDNTYPTGFSMTAGAGSNYTVSGLQITPSLNFNGVLTVPVTVSDGALSSTSFNLSITVNAANDAPVITGQASLITQEDQPITILLSNLTVTDVDDTYPTGFTLSLQAGSNYTVAGAKITPTLDFIGTLTVGVSVNDGSNNSTVFNLTVQVVPTNDPPTITGQNTVSTAEDQPLVIQLANLLVTDPDDTYPTGFSLSVAAGTNYTVSGTTITPNLNFTGTLSVSVRVNDGVNNSAPFNLQVQVTPVNDVPVITAQSTLTINEDLPLTILLTHLTVADPDNTYPTGFTLNVQSGTNYTVSGSTITPALNFLGNLNVNVTVNDGSLTSAVFSLLVKVNAVNDPPVKLGFAAVNLLEDNVTEQIINLLTAFNDAEDEPSQLTYQISANDNPGFFQAITINQTNGELRFTLNPNVFGTAKVTVRAADTGGLFVTDILTINISPINDAPGFDAIANQQVVENSPQQTINITNISRGPFESTQELTFFVSSSNTSIIPTPTITYNGVATTAQLKYNIAPSISGTATITVNVVDNGSNVAPNQNTFSTTFTIEVSEINDPPTLNAIAFGPILEDAVLQNVPLSGISAGPGETQTLVVSVTTNKPELFEILDVVYQSPQTTGTLRIKPKTNANGVAQISVRVQDSGPNIPPVSINFLVRSFNLTIQSINDVPVFISTPLLTANIGEPYTYNIKVKDVEGETLTLTAPTKPAWASLLTVAVADTAACHCNYRLTGTPPVGSGGSTTVKLQVKDPTSVLIDQLYTLVVNTRPTLTSFAITTNEDTEANVEVNKFSSAFVDADGNALSEIQIITLPKHGILRVNNVAVAAGDKIPVASLLSGLVYAPLSSYNGNDTLYWNGSDGIVYATSPQYINFVVNPVNDAPIISALETDSLLYKSGSGLVLFTEIFKVTDVDDDSLTSAEIRFVTTNFRPSYDILTFTNKDNLTGIFNAQTGVLLISGKAPLSEYDSAIRSIEYRHLNAVDPIQETKTVSITMSDGKSFSEAKNRFITLYFEDVALDITNAFTPNDDEANDTWEIHFENVSASDNPELKDAVLKIYNKRGLLMFETRGFEKNWDGKLNGEFVPADTYFYTIDLKSTNKKTFKGTVTVLR